ncbi:hypothetical protein CHS0354_040823 [Potamilus streckersoni]|uniref:Nucleoporin NSP1-like C-terminal domain-containing protein n=1 Tax=Potamilus streckersoni TaxID=2493646 RepID=A0AAE0VXW7_9BIVA|nr:hypothetical protein CHS0354_040823 [Potamilus streckersoni]
MFGNSGGSGPNKTIAGSGFTFVGQTSTSGAGTGTGFNFGTPGSTGSTGFNFQSLSTSSQTPKAGQASGTGAGFAFGNPGSTAATGFNLPTGSISKDAAPLSSASTGFLSGSGSLPSTTGSGFSLGTASTGLGFSLGTASTGLGFSQGGTTSTAVGFGFGSTPITSTTSGGFQPGGSTTVSNPNLSSLLGKQPATTITTGTGSTTGTPGLFASPVPGSGGFKLGGSTAASAPISTASQVSTSASVGFNFGTTTTAASSSATPGFSFASTTSTAPMLGQTAALTSATSSFGLGVTSSAGSLNKLPSTTSAVTTSTVTSTSGASSGSPAKQMNYRQLEEQINKWMLDLEEQERVFLQQATQVNAWDTLLVENGEKILSLNQDMERVKIDQQKLDHELDFIHSQQRELEDLLVPLEKSVEQLPSSSFQPHADLERENTYQLAENIDAQLKRMLQDLKEIIDHLNTSNSGQDNQDPIQQITKILNAHMDSLQWIDSNSALLSRRVEEISKQMETQRKEQERSFRLVYD